MPRGTAHAGLMAWLRMRVAAFRQTPDQIFRRNAGDRSLTGPYPVQDSARRDWQYALLSVAAYGRSNPKRRSAKAGDVAPDIEQRLRKAGWELWPDFPDPKLAKEMEESHLRAEVWEHAGEAIVVAAFGGTVFTSGKDWGSNLRWFMPWHKDEYSEIVSRFAPDFVCALANRIKNGDPAYWQRVKVYSTGHSLGGGLAQQFAYALPIGSGVPKVSEVYSFDPSPVTGFYSVKRALRNHNKYGLKIGRIYERGEVLAVMRSITSLIWKPTAANAEIRGSRYNLFYSLNPIVGHSIEELARRMHDVAEGHSPAELLKRNRR
jgi:hypothetical protein